MRWGLIIAMFGKYHPPYSIDMKWRKGSNGFLGDFAFGSDLWAGNWLYLLEAGPAVEDRCEGST